MARSPRRSLFLVVPLLVLAACAAPEQETAGPAQTEGPQSIVLVVMDGVRADAVGAWGGEVATPNLDALAAEGLRFDWAFTQSPVREPALASLLTGLYPTTHGLMEADDFLVDEAATLAEAAADAGWATVAFVDEVGDQVGLAQGFATFQVTQEPEVEAARWLAERRGEQFLLAVVLRPPSAGLAGMEEGEARAAYAAFVQHTDGVVGTLMEAVGPERMAEDVTVAVVSARGFEQGEHGVVGESVPYTTVTRVPMLLRPAGGAGAVVVEDLVEVVDLMPTLLEQAGLGEPEGVQGASLLPLTAGQGRPPYIAFGESLFERYVALGGYGMVVTSEGERELFNLADDPLQLEDVSAAEAHRVDVLSDHLEAWGKMVAAASLDPDRRIEELDDATLDQLRSLGYIQ